MGDDLELDDPMDIALSDEAEGGPQPSGKLSADALDASERFGSLHITLPYYFPTFPIPDSSSVTLQSLRSC